jgi:hypothetical protein
MTNEGMSEKLMNNLDELSASIEQNSAQIKLKLSSGGVTPDPAVVTSAAKYYKALERLAKE